MVQRIVVVEDHPAVRASLGMWLAQRFPEAQLAEAESGEAGITMARDLRPDLVVMDIALPGIDGIQATREITRTLPGVAVVVVSIHETAAHREAAAAAGAAAYVAKRTMAADLGPALAAALGGNPEPRGAAGARRERPA